MDRKDVREWLECDKLEKGHPMMSDQDIFESVVGREEENSDSDDEEDDEGDGTDSDGGDEKAKALSSLDFAVSVAQKSMGGSEAVALLLQAKRAFAKLSL